LTFFKKRDKFKKSVSIRKNNLKSLKNLISFLSEKLCGSFNSSLSDFNSYFYFWFYFYYPTASLKT